MLATHPGVLECAAVGVPDEKSGEAVKVVIVRKDPGLTREDVIEIRLPQPADRLQAATPCRISRRAAENTDRQDPAARPARSAEKQQERRRDRGAFLIGALLVVFARRMLPHQLLLFGGTCA